MVMIKSAKFLFIVGGAFALGTPAYAFQVDQSEASDGTETTAVTEIICRQAAAPTGSRIRPRNICKTQREWDQIEQEARLAVENVGLRNRQFNEGANTGCGAFGRNC